jgi:hypothetical protein
VTSNKETIQMFLGAGLGAAISLAIVAEVSSLLRSNAQRIVAGRLIDWCFAQPFPCLGLG